jgi:cystinosin
MTVFILEGLLGVPQIPHSFNTFRMGGYGKALITLVKYCPQVYLNWSRKSTVGWSIFNIMCDFTGGVFSVLQQFIDMAYEGMTTGDWSFFNSGTNEFNIVKFFLGVISIIFDCIFMVQHFILYPEKNNENSKLLNDPSQEHFNTASNNNHARHTG